MKHPGPTLALTQMAANVGDFNTGQELQQMDLAQGAYGLHQQAQEEQIRHQRDAEALQAAQMVLQDDRQRDINQINADTRVDVAGLNGQNAMDRTQVQQAGSNQRTSYNANAAAERNTATNDIRLRVNNDRINSAEGIAAGREALGYYGIDQRAKQDEQRQRERVALETARTAAQMERAQGRLDRSAALAQVHALITEKQRQRSILETRARNGDGQAAQYIDRLNGEIKGLVDRIVPPSPATASPGMPGGVPPTPYDAQQPDGRQPAPNMNGMMQQPVNVPPIEEGNYENTPAGAPRDGFTMRPTAGMNGPVPPQGAFPPPAPARAPQPAPQRQPPPLPLGSRLLGVKPTILPDGTRLATYDEVMAITMEGLKTGVPSTDIARSRGLTLDYNVLARPGDPPSMNPGPGPQSMAAPPPVRVSTVEQARTLPPGTQFFDPYGTLRVVA